MLAASASGCGAAGYTVFTETAAFSSDIGFTAKIMGGRAEYAHTRMTEIIADIDAQVSLTRPESDLCEFNAADANVKVEVGVHCYELFLLAREYGELTMGAFNAAAAPLVELWHLDAESIEKYRPNYDGTHVSPPLPSVSDVERVKAYCDIGLVTASTENGRYYLEKSDGRVKLDFGGIAKGYAIDKCVEALGEYEIASALLDISGNAYFYGDYIERGKKTDWHVGIVAPRPRAAETLTDRGYVCAVSVASNTSAVTSGDYMRYYIHDGASAAVYVPHIIGRDGVPIGVELSPDGEWVNADDYVISATVLGESSALSDALSTAVAALGAEEGARLLQKVGCKGLIFTEKRFTIVGGVELYKPDVYNGFEAFESV